MNSRIFWAVKIMQFGESSVFQRNILVSSSSTGSKGKPASAGFLLGLCFNPEMEMMSSSETSGSL
jgi:hypothetical protein